MLRLQRAEGLQTGVFPGKRRADHSGNCTIHGEIGKEGLGVRGEEATGRIPRRLSTDEGAVGPSIREPSIFRQRGAIVELLRARISLPF
jgi:hypothetical protein